MSVAEAAASGDRRESLAAMRDRIARAVDDADTPPRDLAALSRRLQLIMEDIAAIDARESEESDSAEVEDGEFDPEAI